MTARQRNNRTFEQTNVEVRSHYNLNYRMPHAATCKTARQRNNRTFEQTNVEVRSHYNLNYRMPHAATCKTARLQDCKTFSCYLSEDRAVYRSYLYLLVRIFRMIIGVRFCIKIFNTYFFIPWIDRICRNDLFFSRFPAEIENTGEDRHYWKNKCIYSC